MPVSVSHKAPFWTLCTLFGVILAAGCGSGEKAGKSSVPSTKTTSPALAGDQGGGVPGVSRGDLDPGNVENIDWQDDYSDLTRRPNRPGGPEQADSRTARSAYWTIVLRTYGGDTDGLMARDTLDELRRRMPEMARADMHVTSKGS